MAKLIKLSKGKFAIVDDEDFEWLNSWKWHLSRSSKNLYYAQAWDNGRTVQMHRKILGVTNPKILLDHKNRDPLDNRKENLRIATQSQNMANATPRKNCSSKFRGVQWCKDRGNWRVQVVKDGVRKWLGRFDNEIDAALAYNKAAIEIHGEFAFINQITIP